MKSNSGFTMVEIVVVLVLLGIVSAVVIPRFLSASAFDALGARNAIITTARSAQQLALGRDLVTFTLTNSGSEWLASANVNGSSLRAATFPSNSLSLETGSTAASNNSCANDFNSALTADFSISFDGQGNAVSLTNNSSTETIANGVRLCINDEVSLSVCVSPGGFAYVGTCDD